MSVYIGGTKVAGLEKELPAQAGNAGKYLYTDGQNASWEEASTAQIWIGTQAEYEALGTYDPEVVYQVTDDFQNLIPNVGQITEDVNNLKAHSVVAFQAPTAQNNYTWYRKYADGWVEQGGVSTLPDVTFPITMADTNYFCSCLPKVYSNEGGSIDAQYTNKSTTGCQFNLRWQGGYAGINTSCERLWEVKGMVA